MNERYLYLSCVIGSQTKIGMLT
uniref:Uncharacterized protein n=1 Tax=Anguilla anguilla TaxID=7936 RepID=A0A0E9QUM1_ANGAN